MNLTKVQRNLFLNSVSRALNMYENSNSKFEFSYIDKDFGYEKPGSFCLEKSLSVTLFL